MKRPKQAHLSKQDAISASAFLGQQIRPYFNYFDLSIWGVDFPPLRHRYTTCTLLTSYLLDYVIMAIILGLIGFFSLTHHPDPLFTLNDPSLSYPLVDEIVPNWLFFFLCLAVPAVVFVAIYIMVHIKNNMVRGLNHSGILGRFIRCFCSCAVVEEDVEFTNLQSKDQRKKHLKLENFDPHNLKFTGFHDLHHAFLGLVASVLISLLICSFLWVVSPGLRPNHYAVCKIQKDKIIPGKILYSTREICSPDAFSSSIIETPAFPSGHAANSFGCWIYTFLYLNGKFKIWDNHSYAWKIFLCFAVPILIPTGISASRYTDYHHSGFQILFGSAIGILAAFAAYRIYFCSWFDNRYNHLATCFTWVSQAEYESKKDMPPYFAEDSGVAIDEDKSGTPLTPDKNSTVISIASISNPEQSRAPITRNSLSCDYGTSCE